MDDPTQRAMRFLPYLIVFIVAAVLTASHTPAGAALSIDSLFYLATAEGIREGHGIVHETHAIGGPVYAETLFWPPLYSAVLASITWLSDKTATSDVIGIAIFNIFVLAVTLSLLYRITASAASSIAGLVVAIVFALSPSIQVVHTYAWSEVLFIPLSLAAYLNLRNYLANQGRKPVLDLAYAVVLFGVASYTRYVGLAFFAAAGLALLLYGRGDWLSRFRVTAVAGLAYLVIITPMFIRNIGVSGSLSGGDRGAPDWNFFTDLKQLGWYSYLEFLNLPAIVAVVIGLLSIGALIWLLRPSAETEQQADLPGSFDAVRSIALPLLFAGCYFSFLLIARSRQTIDLDSRMLSVGIPFVLIGLLAAYHRLSMRSSARLAVLPFLLPLVAFSFNAAHAHSSIVSGWRTIGEPGPVLGLTYRSITGRQMDTLRGINEHFSPAAGELVLTDIERPIIVKRLFPLTDVRRIPDLPDADALNQLQRSLARHGIAIIRTEPWSRALSNELDGRADFYTVAAPTGETEYVVIKLPVETP